MTENELKLTLELWTTRKQLIEVTGQLLAHQMQHAEAQIKGAQDALAALAPIESPT